MIQHILSRFFRRRVRVVNLPEVCGRRLALTEVREALLRDPQGDIMKAVLQILWMRRDACDRAAAKDAWKGADTRFQLGGREALDELLADMAGLMEGAAPDKEMEAFFMQT